MRCSNRRGNVSNVLLAILALFGVGMLVTIGTGMWMFSYFPKEQKLRNSVEAKMKERDLVFDTMFKTIQQKAGVTKEYRDSFKDIYPDIISGRYQTGGSLAKFVTESNPHFDTSLLKDLMASIEAERKSLLNVQTSIVDTWREHTDLVTVPPGCWILGVFGKNERIPEEEVKLITSTTTKEAAETGEENNVELFGENK